jgi:hypothetical protein
VRTILEIGASSGEGSTEALIAGARHNPSKPVIYSIEVSPRRFRALVERHRTVDILRPYNVSSVSLERFSSEDRVREFYEAAGAKLYSVPLRVVLGWLKDDRRTVAENDLSRDGIRMIKAETGIDEFDAVLIDGSEFTGAAELEDVYGSRFILLDDILTFKNLENYRRLANDPMYALLEKSEELRNGYAVFARVDAARG